MTIREMHYDVKQKLNKLDSQKYRDLAVPEIDWNINEAQEIFAKMVAEPRVDNGLGFEVTQRSIDDVRTIVVDQKPTEYIVATLYDDTSYIVALPDDYWFLVKPKIMASKGKCTSTLLYDSTLVQHDDEVEFNSFDKSSFEWRCSNYRFNREGIRVFTDGSYTIDKVGFEYLKKPRVVYNAADWEGGTYNSLNGDTYTGTQDCELPEGTHREIVDLAVLIMANNLNLPSYGLKMNKIKTIN